MSSNQNLFPYNFVPQMTGDCMPFTGAYGFAANNMATPHNSLYAKGIPEKQEAVRVACSNSKYAAAVNKDHSCLKAD